MAKAIEIDTGAAVVPRDQADDAGITRSVYEPAGSAGGIVVYRITGAFFFGATATVGAVLDGISQLPKVFILDFEHVPLVDSSAAKVLRSSVTKLGRAGTVVYFTGAKPGVRAVLLKAGLRQPDVRYLANLADAEAAAKEVLG
jgi:SulP family sulfate permease